MNTHDLAFKAANGMLSFDAEGEWRLNQKEVERFAHLVRAQVLEEAAGVCEEVCDDPHVVLHVGTVCAAAIRALKEGKT